MNLRPFWPESRYTDRPVGARLGGAGITVSDRRATSYFAAFIGANLLDAPIRLHRQRPLHHQHQLIKLGRLGWLTPPWRGHHPRHTIGVGFRMRRAHMLINQLAIVAGNDCSRRNFLDHLPTSYRNSMALWIASAKWGR